MNVGTWPAGVTIELYNNGIIKGYTGVRGVTGTGLYTRNAITIDNLNGEISSGGTEIFGIAIDGDSYITFTALGIINGSRIN